MNKFSPTLIGGFVLGAITLLVSALLIFGGGQVFRDYQQAVIFFQGSVGGLRAGAPVDFRGVQIGTVKDISIQYDSRTDQFLIPVVVDLDPTRVRDTSRASGQPAHYTIESLIERGLRAELRTQSLVTGQLAVQLNFFPRTEARLVETDLPYPQIPSVASTFEQATEILTEIGREAPAMVIRMNQVLDRAATLLGEFSGNGDNIHQLMADLAKFSKALGDSDQDIRAAVSSAAKLTANLDRVAGHADGAVLEFGDVAKRANKLLADNDGAIRSMIAQLNRAGTGLARLTDSLNAIALDNREGLKDFTSSGLYDLTNLIKDTQDMVNNLNRAIDDLRRNPNQFLFGQQQREVPAGRTRGP
jgi:paraquat-inducible protein B